MKDFIDDLLFALESYWPYIMGILCLPVLGIITIELLYELTKLHGKTPFEGVCVWMIQAGSFGLVLFFATAFLRILTSSFGDGEKTPYDEDQQPSPFRVYIPPQPNPEKDRFVKGVRASFLLMVLGFVLRALV